MRSCLRVALAFFVFVMMGQVVLAPSFAQTTSSATQPDSSPTSATLSELNQLKANYRQQLNTYRNDQRLFEVAKAQYEKLQTLTSLEEAVRSTQKVMTSRQVVLSTYLKILRATLNQTNGIDIPVKEKELKNLDTLLIDMKSHQLKIDASVDRLQLQQAAADYSKLDERVTSRSYFTLSLIAYGQMQSVLDKTMSVRDDVRQHTEATETNALRLAEKKRGLDEIDRNLTQVQNSLLKTKANIFLNPDKSGEGTYGQTVRDLNDAYANLSRSLGLLKESLN
jgi:hypothetical protein